MFILDTNVVSELRKAKTGKANVSVVDWAKSISPVAMFLSTITILELETGILQVERRDPAQGSLLRSWFEEHVLPTFEERILPIDTEVARKCAQLHVPDRKSDRDALIAATAIVHGMTVVTRNIADFEATETKLLNPWENGH